jgi:Fe-S cluster assembly protein SufD
VYTGLIEIERGARRSDARQSNFNLLLSPSAHADSVPNLDIRENDVACSHASSVGPLDELQRWYLESRGVERSDAERLMIQGFFNEMLEGLPDGLARAIESDVATLLAEVVS